MSGCTRFLLHMAIASFLAPACGVAVYTYYEADWTDTPQLSRLTGSLLGGFVLLFFIWFIVVPFGILTYFVCRMLAAAGFTNLFLWSGGGAVVGMMFGLFIASWASLPAGLQATSGSILGLASGMALAAIWRNAPQRESTDTA